MIIINKHDFEGVVDVVVDDLLNMELAVPLELPPPAPTKYIYL